MAKTPHTPDADRHVTMSAIADACDLSHTTVSFVLRGRADKPVNPRTRERVFAQAVSMGYQPQRHRRLDASKLRLLFVCPDFDIAYADISHPGCVIAEMARRQRESNIEVVLAATERQSIMETLYRGVCEGQADAVVVTRMGDDELERVLAHSPVPVIHLGKSAAFPQVPSVGIDDLGVGRQAAELLWSHGHRLVCVMTVDMNVGNLRLEGFRQVWRERSGGRLEPLVTIGGFKAPAGNHQMHQVLDTFDPLPTAIFCISDSIAYGAMQVLWESGKSIPDFMSICGCDNIPWSEWSCPPLTTFDLNVSEVSTHLIRMTRDLCRGRTPDPAQVMVLPSLVPRRSIRRLPT